MSEPPNAALEPQEPPDRPRVKRRRTVGKVWLVSIDCLKKWYAREKHNFETDTTAKRLEIVLAYFTVPHTKAELSKHKHNGKALEHDLLHTREPGQINRRGQTLGR